MSAEPDAPSPPPDPAPSPRIRGLRPRTWFLLLSFLIVGFLVWSNWDGLGSGGRLMSQSPQFLQDWRTALKEGRVDDLRAASTPRLRERLTPEVWQALFARYPELRGDLSVAGFALSAGLRMRWPWNWDDDEASSARVLYRFHARENADRFFVDFVIILRDGRPLVSRMEINGFDAVEAARQP